MINIASFSMNQSSEKKQEKKINKKIDDSLKKQAKLLSGINEINNNIRKNVKDKTDQENVIEFINQKKEKIKKNLLFPFYKSELELVDQSNNIKKQLAFYENKKKNLNNFIQNLRNELNNAELYNLLFIFFLLYLEGFNKYLDDKIMECKNFKKTKNIEILLILIILFAYIGFEFYLIYINF